MLIQISAGSAALKAANTHKDAEELAPLDVNGALVAFDFGNDATIESARESIRSMDAHIGALIADADDVAEVASLSALKELVCGVEREVEREFAYLMNRAPTEEATAPDAESQLHVEQHASINDSSNSNGADDSNDEELNTNGETQEQPERPRSRKRS